MTAEVFELRYTDLDWAVNGCEHWCGRDGSGASCGSLKRPIPGVGALLFWRNPAAWLQEQKLSRSFWVFFTAALLFRLWIFGLLLSIQSVSAGPSLQRSIDRADRWRADAGLGCRDVAGRPAGAEDRTSAAADRLLCCCTAVELCACCGNVGNGTDRPGVSGRLGDVHVGRVFLPAVARLTTEENRASAFSLIFSASIGTSTLGGIVCGYLPQWLSMAGFAMQPAEVKRLILLVSCGIAAMGLLAVLRMRLPLPQSEALEQDPKHDRTEHRRWKLHPFLLRFLPAMALWTAVLASFTPFANVYLSRNLHVPMSQIGLIFSAAQIVQLCVRLLTPMLFRALGMVNGIVATQLLTALALGCLAGTQSTRLAVALYLSFSALQWMSAPGLIQPADEQGTGRGTQHGIVDDDVLQCRDGLGSNRWRRDSVCTIRISACAGGHYDAGCSGGNTILDTRWSDGPSHTDATAGDCRPLGPIDLNCGHRDVFSVEKRKNECIKDNSSISRLPASEM